jgi:hypothetical protein
MQSANRDKMLAWNPEAHETVAIALKTLKKVHQQYAKEIPEYGNFRSLLVGLVSKDGGLEYYDGFLRIKDGNGNTIADKLDPRKYYDYFGEATEPWSYLKFPYYKPFGYPDGMYRVGPLARVNICDYIETPLAEADIPKGEVLKFSFADSKIFPGTYRDYWVYVPAQYSPDQPACVYVNQDGIQWQAPKVFDQLIHAKEMPVTIGVFVMHGRVRAADTNSALDRFNRSFEYDGLGDNYARFLLEELLPDVEARKTSDGRAIRLSTNATDRAIGGSSSGAICGRRVP